MTLPPTWSALRPLVEWHVRSHLAARRNALIASTALAQRRRERIEVEEFMAVYLDARSAATLSA